MDLDDAAAQLADLEQRAAAARTLAALLDEQAAPLRDYLAAHEAERAKLRRRAAYAALGNVCAWCGHKERAGTWVVYGPPGPERHHTGLWVCSSNHQRAVIVLSPEAWRELALTAAERAGCEARLTAHGHPLENPTYRRPEPAPITG